MYIELYFYIPVLTTIICALVLLLSPKPLLHAHRYLVACMFLIALSLFLFAQFFNHHIAGYMGFDFLYSLLVSFCAPAYFYYTRLVTSPTGFKKYDWMALIPSAFELLLSLFCFGVMFINHEFSEFAQYASYGHVVPETVTPSFKLVAFLGSQFFAAFLAAQIVFFVLYSHRLTLRYHRALKDFYSTPEERFKHVFYVSVCSVIVIVISFVIVLVPINLLDNVWFILPASIAASIIQIILTYYAYRIDSSAEDMNVDTDEPEQSTMPELSSEYAEQLKKLFRDDRLYLDPDLTLVSLAKKLGTNRTYASRLIQEMHHVSFSEFINQCRINYAQEVMRTSAIDNLKMSDLALMCGFASEQSFYRNFKNFTGQTPTTWFAENIK